MPESPIRSGPGRVFTTGTFLPSPLSSSAGRAYTAKESEFHRVTCFNGLAKTVGQYCSKGQLVSFQGRIHYTQWEDKDGVTRYGTEILADKVDFLSRGNGSADDNNNQDAPEID